MMFAMDEIILPPPKSPFAWQPSRWGPSLVCREIEPFARHLFTTRPWTLGGDGSAPVPDSAWRDVADAMQVDLGMLVRARQVHGCGVLIAETGREPPPGADIIITRDAARAIAVRAADCAPLLIVDRRRGAVAAAHAGWRGMALRAPVTAVEALAGAYGCRPADLLAAVGPSIGACCYQVGPDVREAFGKAFVDHEPIDRWFLDRPMADERNPPLRGLDARPERWFFDGWAAVRAQLTLAGVPADQIFVAELCTASHPHLFCSFRRDGPLAGRLAAVITPASHRP